MTLSRAQAARVLREAVRRAHRAKTSLERYCPQVPTERQQAFLDCTATEVLYGGAAGGGKSSALLMGALRYVHVPGYAAIIFRRKVKDLQMADALIERSHTWLAGTDAQWNEQNKRWDFPGGGALYFGYLDSPRDNENYQGGAYQFIGFDESSQIRRAHYLYLRSRLRRPSEGPLAAVPLCFASATNPGSISHDFLFQRFVDPKTRLPDTAYIPARLDDNPHLDAEEYRRQLAFLDPVTRRQLEFGEWVKDVAGRMWLFDPARNIVPSLPAGRTFRYTLGLDFGASASSPTSSFVVLAVDVHAPKAYVVESFARPCQSPEQILDYLAQLCKRYEFTHIVGDQGALGAGYIKYFVDHGVPVQPADKRDRLASVRLMNGALHDARLLLLAGANDDFATQLSETEWNEACTDSAPGSLDHLADACRYGLMASRAHLFTPEASPWDNPSLPLADRLARDLDRREEAAFERAAEPPSPDEEQIPDWEREHDGYDQGDEDYDAA